MRGSAFSRLACRLCVSSVDQAGELQALRSRRRTGRPRSGGCWRHAPPRRRRGRGRSAPRRRCSPISSGRFADLGGAAGQRGVAGQLLLDGAARPSSGSPAGPRWRLARTDLGRELGQRIAPEARPPPGAATACGSSGESRQRGQEGVANFAEIAARKGRVAPAAPRTPAAIAGWFRQPARIAPSRMRASTRGSPAARASCEGRRGAGPLDARRRAAGAPGPRARVRPRAGRGRGGGAKSAARRARISASQWARSAGSAMRARCARRRASSAARRSGLSSTAPSVSRAQSRSTIGREASSSACSAARAAVADHVVGVLARAASARSAASGRGRAAAARGRSAAARRPGRRRRRRARRTGSGASFQSSSSWASVIAVPSGATAWSRPGLGQRDHVHVALDDDHRAGLARRRRGPGRRCRGCGPCRRAACRASSGTSAPAPARSRGRRRRWRGRGRRGSGR